VELVTAGQTFSFNYTAFDQYSSLFIGFNIYDVSSGSAVFVALVHGAYSAFGVYSGTYLGVTGKTYLVIGLAYTDGTYTTASHNRSPSADIYQVASSTVTYLGFAYATYDLNSSLSLQATVYNLSSGSPVFVQTAVMTYVAFGVYFGSFTGTIGNTYQIAQAVYSTPFSTVDPTRGAACDGFDCINITAGSVTYVQIQNATLTGQNLSAVLSITGSLSVGNISFTQGDSAVLNLTATDGNGNPIDITGATFVTQIKGPSGSFITSFPNSQHSIVNGPLGQYQLSLATTDTPNCGIGSNKEIVTQMTNGLTVLYLHGPGLLTVNPPVPLT
jgi:hypothetical protein